MVGMEIKGDAARAVPLCQDKGLLVNCIGGKSLRFFPPLIVTKADIDTAVSILEEVLSAIA